MANEQDPPRDPIEHFDYSADGEPAEPAKRVVCAACRGTGTVLLLVSARPCEACGGTGRIARTVPSSGSAHPAGSTSSTGSAGSPQSSSEQAPLEGRGEAPSEPAGTTPHSAEEAAEPAGSWLYTSTYDALGRLKREQQKFVPNDPPPASRAADKSGTADGT